MPLRELDNQLRLRVDAWAGARASTVVVAVQAGSRCDPPEAPGVAHLTEHLFFRGTARKPDRHSLLAPIEQAGGEVNASTAKDVTLLYLRCMAQEAATGIEVLADVLADSRFDPGAIEEEIRVVHEEIKSSADTPRNRISDVYDELVYGDTPLGRPVRGSGASLSRLRREDLVSYVARWYVPSRTVVAVGGALDDRAVETAERLFGGWPDRPAPTPLPPASSFSAPGPRVRCVGGGERTVFRLGAPAPSTVERDAPAARVYASLLGGGQSALLPVKLQHELGLPVSVSASYAGYADCGSLYVQVYARDDLARRCVEAVVEALHSLAFDGVDADELRLAKARLRGQLALALSDSRATALLAKRQLESSSELTPAGLVAEVDAVSASEVSKLAQRLVEHGSLRLAVVGGSSGEGALVHAMETATGRRVVASGRSGRLS